MHAAIFLEYSIDDKIRKLDDEARQRLCDGFPALEIPMPPASLDGWEGVGWSKHDHTIDLTTTGAMLVDLGITFEIKRFAGCRKVASDSSNKTVNLQVAIPNLLLFAVDEVMVLEDECTDRLQSHLDDGWRILAVCPPANQRRPDYVLGRQKAMRD